MPRQSKSKTTEVVDTPVSNTPLPVVAEPVVKVAKAKKVKTEPVQSAVTPVTAAPFNKLLFPPLLRILPLLRMLKHPLLLNPLSLWLSLISSAL